MKLHPKSLAISAVILSAALAACQEPYHQKEEQYYLISANIGLPYWQEAEAGLRDAATGMGVKAEMDGPATLSPQEELDSFNKAVALHPAGILFAGTDNFRAGQESGKRMADILKGQGQVVIISIPGQLNLDERVRGVN